MRVAVVYESLFGNTRQVAEAIAEGIQAAGPGAVVKCSPVTEAGPALAEVDLLVAGGPTHFLGMTSQRSRRMQHQYQVQAARHGGRQVREDRPVSRGVREWLDALPPAAGGKRAAAFDTRLAGLFPGSAARLIARGLLAHGYQLAAEPEGFLVEKFEGPLQAGERDRARAWGASLASGPAPHPQAVTGGGGPQRPTRFSPGRGAARFAFRAGLSAPSLRPACG